MPPITKNLIIINLLLFLGTEVASMNGIDLEQYLALHYFMAGNFRPWQLLTYMFMHGGLMHILFNMFALWMFGRIVETNLGPKRFMTYYLVCGIGAGLLQECAQMVHYYYEGLGHYAMVNTGSATIPMEQYLNLWRTVGASGAVYGLLLSFAMMFPEQRMFIFPIPIPIKSKYFVAGYAVIELLEAMGTSNDQVAHCAHLGGMLFGLLLMLHWMNRLHMPHIAMPRFRRRPRMKVHQGGSRLTPDEEYNLHRKERQEEIDRILDKVRRRGYGSLTEQEKRTLFNAGK